MTFQINPNNPLREKKKQEKINRGKKDKENYKEKS